METFKDSGQRSEFNTGAVRDVADNKGRFDLLPADAVRQLARVMETGCLKYGDRNWEKGIPLRRYIDSAMRHLFCLMAGMEDEPHLSMAMWNVACAIQTEVWIRRGKLPDSLRDEFPFQIRLLPTGDVQEFADIVGEAPPQPLASVTNWMPSGIQWRWQCSCGNCGHPEEEIERWHCLKCGREHVRPPRHVAPGPTQEFADRVAAFWYYACPCGMSGNVSDQHLTHKCAACGEIHHQPGSEQLDKPEDVVERVTTELWHIKCRCGYRMSVTIDTPTYQCYRCGRVHTRDKETITS